RAVEDHHVDRPGVEAQQCVELTGTNSSIGLIALIMQCSSWPSPPAQRAGARKVGQPRAQAQLGPCGDRRAALRALRWAWEPRAPQWRVRPVCLTPLPTW